jgi:hypothetical protein
MPSTKVSAVIHIGFNLLHACFYIDLFAPPCENPSSNIVDVLSLTRACYLMGFHKWGIHKEVAFITHSVCLSTHDFSANKLKCPKIYLTRFVCVTRLPRRDIETTSMSMIFIHDQ